MRKNVIYIIIALFASVQISAQIGVQTPYPRYNAALEVASDSTVQQGLMPPHAVQTNITLQDEVEVKPDSMVSVNNDGLLFYEEATGCYKYWKFNATDWLTLCGTPKPAVFEFTDCYNAQVMGTFLKGDVLSINNYLQIPVSVSRPGTYVITSTVKNAGGNDENYYFTTSGTFPTSGDFIINIPGIGTPLSAGIHTVEVSLNGKPSACIINVSVRDKDPDYCIVEVTQMNPTWPINTDLTASNNYKIGVKLLVNNPGEWGLTTSEVNGYSFSGSGQIAAAQGYNPAADFPQTVTVAVPVAYGKANAYGTGVDRFTISTTTSRTACNGEFNIRLTDGGFSLQNCETGFTFNNPDNVELKNGQPVPFNSSVDLFINVSANMDPTVIYAEFAGATYATSILQTDHYVISAVPLAKGTQFIRLYPIDVTTLITPSSRRFNAIGSALPVNIWTADIATQGVNSGKYENSLGCQIVAPEIKPAVAQFGSLLGDPDDYVTPMNEIEPQTVPLPDVTLAYNISVAGSLNLTTNTANGVYFTFSSGATDLEAGTGTIHMTAHGTPIKYGRATYTATYPQVGETEENATGTVTFTVGYAYTAVKILVLGDQARTGSATMGAFMTELASEENFGPAGIVPTMTSFANFYYTAYNDLGITSSTYNAARAETIKNFINSQNISVIMILNDYDAAERITEVLRDFVVNKNGAVICASAYGGDAWAEATYAALMLQRTGTPSTSTATGGFSNGIQITTDVNSVNNHYLNLDHPILNGPFGDLRGMSFGTEGSPNAGYLQSGYDPLTSTILCYNDDRSPTHPYIVVHNTKGVVWLGDENFNYGPVSSTNPDPETSDEEANQCNAAGIPWTFRFGSNAAGTPMSNNGMLTLNLIAWAMDYAQHNTNFNYQIP
jgi:hypothetical protein